VDLRRKLAAEADKPKSEVVVVPKFNEFVRLPSLDPLDRGGEFWDKHGIGHYQKATTVRFYRDRFRVLSAADFAAKPLDQIDNKDGSAFTSRRREAKLSVATINRDLASLRMVLNLARLWKYVRELPVIKLGRERETGTAISHVEEAIYMTAVDQDHRDFALIMIETGLEPSEAAPLLWSDVHFGQIGHWEHGYIHDRCQKTWARERDLGMTPPLAARLWERRTTTGGSPYVFPSAKDLNHPTPSSAFQTKHQRLWKESKVRTPLAIPKFRIYDFRHTAITRFDAAGATMSQLMQFAGWTSSAMAKRYVKRNTATQAKNVQRLHEYNENQRRIAGIGQNS
jgi:integrase